MQQSQRQPLIMLEESDAPARLRRGTAKDYERVVSPITISVGTITLE